MKKKRFIIIMFEKHLLSFYLFNKKGSKIELIATSNIRIIRNSFNFSISEYILDYLSLWGKELGIKLTKENVPILDQRENEGVSDIYFFAPKRNEDLKMISKKIMLINDDIQQEGVKNVRKLLDFNNLLYVSLGSLETSMVRYFQKGVNTMKVIVEKKDLHMRKYLKDEDLLDSLKKVSKVNGQDDLIDMFTNVVHVPIFNIEDKDGAMLEYFLNELRLRSFKNCSKLKLSSFGIGDVNENLLIIGGERQRFIGNDSLEVLSILDNLDLKGNFSVYIDKYGMFDVFQRFKKQYFTNDFYKSFSLEFWGSVVVIEGNNKAKKDEIVADVDVLETESEKQIIPMFGRLVMFDVDDEADIELKTRDKSYIGNGKKQTTMEIKDYSGKFVIDARRRPIQNDKCDLVDVENVSEVTNWFKNLSIVK